MPYVLSSGVCSNSIRKQRHSLLSCGGDPPIFRQSVMPPSFPSTIPPCVGLPAHLSGLFVMPLSPSPHPLSPSSPLPSFPPSGAHQVWGYLRTSLACAGRAELMAAVDGKDQEALARQLPLSG